MVTITTVLVITAVAQATIPITTLEKDRYVLVFFLILVFKHVTTAGLLFPFSVSHTTLVFSLVGFRVSVACSCTHARTATVGVTECQSGCASRHHETMHCENRQPYHSKCK